MEESMNPEDVAIGRKVEVAIGEEVVEVGYVMKIDNSGPHERKTVHIFSLLEAGRKSRFFLKGDSWLRIFFEPGVKVQCFCPQGPYHEIRQRA